ncbi:hypothetical protein ACFY4B_37345 [Kitasatospora sp. NPDC001261]
MSDAPRRSCTHPAEVADAIAGPNLRGDGATVVRSRRLVALSAPATW